MRVRARFQPSAAVGRASMRLRLSEPALDLDVGRRALLGHGRRAGARRAARAAHRARRRARGCGRAARRRARAARGCAVVRLRARSARGRAVRAYLARWRVRARLATRLVPRGLSFGAVGAARRHVRRARGAAPAWQHELPRMLHRYRRRCLRRAFFCGGADVPLGALADGVRRGRRGPVGRRRRRAPARAEPPARLHGQRLRARRGARRRRPRRGRATTRAPRTRRSRARCSRASTPARRSRSAARDRRQRAGWGRSPRVLPRARSPSRARRSRSSCSPRSGRVGALLDAALQPDDGRHVP